MIWSTQKRESVAITELVSEINCRHDCATKEARHGSYPNSSSLILQAFKISSSWLDQSRPRASKSNFCFDSFISFALEYHISLHLRVVCVVELTSSFQDYFQVAQKKATLRRRNVRMRVQNVMVFILKQNHFLNGKKNICI